jgi:hypothetical protein
MFERIHDFLDRDGASARHAQRQARAAEGFKLAPSKGLPYYLKFALFALFGYYNVKLFLTTIPGWEAYLTALFALGLEALAMYCIINFVRSADLHKTTLGICGGILTVFSFTHATLSFFKVERNARWQHTIEAYSQNVAFPLLFALLFVSSLAIYLTHFNQKVTQQQARTMVEIETRKAQMLAESHAMRAESQLDREKLERLEERIDLKGRYIQKLGSFLELQQKERRMVEEIPDEALRDEVARALGHTLNQPKPKADEWPASKPGKM